MDASFFKSVAFGGFDKQDVIRYIQQTAEKAAAEQQALQAENERLSDRVRSLEAETEDLRGQLAASEDQRAALRSQLERESLRRQSLEELEPLKEEAARLQAEADALRPDAQAFAQFRERIGAIECDARKRAADLEDASLAQLRQTVERFQNQYLTLMDAFEASAAHVTGELRKVEVSLAQLPRAMDRTSAELKELSSRLDGPGKAGNSE